MSTVLIVDDDVGTSNLLEILLTRNDFKCIVAHGGREAIKIAGEKRPDLILLDVMMPEIDGIDTCEAIRANKSLRHTPIIMLTALSGIDDKVRAFEAGADDYVTKPVHKAELLSRIKVLLARRMRGNRGPMKLNRVPESKVKND